MKKLIILCSLCCVLFGCDNVEKKAAIRLQAARTAFEQGDYNEAKLQIDSIKLLYPKAFETRRAGIHLMQEVELAEQQKTILYLDSLLEQKQAEQAKAVRHMTLEKDAEYQQIGDYIHPSQVIEKNLNRSFLRFMADERGVLKMTSIYCGSRSIHHTAVKVTAPDGSFAETPLSRESYETTNLGRNIEKCDFKLGNDGNVMGFIYLNRGKDLCVDFLGEQSYSTSMSATDRQALAATYELAQILSSITEIKKSREEAQQKKQFIQKKIEERNTEGNPEQKAGADR
ncbi:MAG: hypothetical protein IJZ86_10020 [Bacteroides sp.]|nr:hypothetical protein [Bacteroides sp.]